ncbi:branched-chain amino acid ABC transporter permease [Actinospongicola halichondriae]|uniref:branched-chain amino acid ABC transporter permease n=1 Tax=Actinospongicola halichondriae TaxID=3236844 RepID=UPI003D3A53EE
MAKFLDLTANGVATGMIYALIALGFVIIYKATHVLNFAQGGLVALGAYFTYNASVTWGLPFPIACVLGVLMTAAVGVVVERLVLRRMVGQPVFAVIMVTIGLLFMMNAFIEAVWGAERLNQEDPWGLKTVRIGDVALEHRELWAMGTALVILAAFFAFFRFSPLGVAMRATAVDQEAATAQGISPRMIFALSWGIAGGVGAVAGIFLSTGSRAAEPAIGLIALVAFPAIILGGLDSPIGAVVGGIIIGITQNLTGGYINTNFEEFVGTTFDRVMPYVVMIVILLVRPYGLFGTKEVQRI